MVPVYSRKGTACRALRRCQYVTRYIVNIVPLSIREWGLAFCILLCEEAADRLSYFSTYFHKTPIYHLFSSVEKAGGKGQTVL